MKGTPESHREICSYFSYRLRNTINVFKIIITSTLFIYYIVVLFYY